MTEAMSQDTLKENWLKSFKVTIRIIFKAMDTYIADEQQDQRLRRSIIAARPALIEDTRNYIKVIIAAKDDEITISLLRYSETIVGLVFSLGTLLGWRYKSKYIRNIIKKSLRDRTLNARHAALEKRSPIKQQKKDITIDVARCYIRDKQIKKLTRNALMVKIRSDIEKRCKSSKISAPSPTSISNYLKESGLP